MRVGRGVTLTGYATDAGNRFRVIALPAPEGACVKFELRDEKGALRYTADLDTEPAPAPSAVDAIGPLASSPWPRAGLYSPQTLFHGKHFQVLHGVVDTAYGVATLVVANGA